MQCRVHDYIVIEVSDEDMIILKLKFGKHVKLIYENKVLPIVVKFMK